MNATCPWCGANGTPGQLDAVARHAGSLDHRGICWQHMLLVLGTGRAPAPPWADRDGDGDARLLLIVARQESQLFLRTCIRFFGRRGIEVLLDRRRGQRRQTTWRCAHDRRRADRRHPAEHWEDLRHYPVTIVPVMSAGRGVTRPQHAISSGEEIMETIDEFTQTRTRLDQWTREGQQLIGHVIPSLIDEWDGQRQQVQRLCQEIKDKDGEIDELKRERTEIAEATSSYLHEINRVTTEVARRLKGTDERVRAKSTLRAV